MVVIFIISISGDLGVIIKYLNDYCDSCLVDYSLFLDEFIFYLKQRVGLENFQKDFTFEKPYDIMQILRE
jgi:hypothetical protein